LVYKCHITIALTSVKFGLSNATCEPHNPYFCPMEIANNIKEDQITIKIVSSYQGTNWVVLHQQLLKTQNLIYAQIP
jgi:hypothetical protein